METYIAKKEGDKLYLFKKGEKVGEISPEAIWVKEGDEFDEDEVFKWEGVINAPDGQIVPTFYTIKGPCGHFH